MKISNLKKIPPRGRLMLASCAGLTLVFGTLLVTSMGRDSSPLEEAGVGANVELSANNSKIEAPSLGKEVIIPEGSPLAVEIEQIKEAEIEDAKSENISYIEQLRFNNEDKVLTKIERELNIAPPETGIDDILKAKDDQAIKRRTELAERKKAIETRRNGDSTTAQVTGYYMLNEEEFLKNELLGASNESSTMSSYINRNVPLKQNMQLSSATKESYQANASKQSNGVYGASEGDYQSKFTSTGKSYGSVNTDQANQIRGIVSNQDASGGSSPTAYEEIVFPTRSNYTTEGDLITAGTLKYGNLQISVNTDEISPVRAIIVSEGKLKNAVLLGSPSKLRDTAVISFNKMALNGKSYSVNILAVDPETLKTSMADNVDRHVFERYFFLAASTIVDGYASALQGVSTTEYPDGTTEEVLSALPSFKDQVVVGLGKYGEVLTPKFEARFDRPSTVTIEGNREIGLLFMDDVQI